MYNVNIWRRVTIPHCEWTRDCSCNWHIKCLILMWSCEAARHSLKSFTFPGARRRVAATQFHNICDCPGHHIILPFRTPVTCPSHCYWADIYRVTSGWFTVMPRRLLNMRQFQRFPVGSVLQLWHRCRSIFGHDGTFCFLQKCLTWHAHNFWNPFMIRQYINRLLNRCQ